MAWRASESEREEEANRATASLAGLAMALALVVLGLYLVGQLRLKAQIEDCLLEGRSDCAQLISTR